MILLVRYPNYICTGDDALKIKYDTIYFLSRRLPGLCER